MNIYVGNLSYEVTENDLASAFEGFGRVESAKVVRDMYSGKSRGFGFVEMPDDGEAQAAIDNLDGKDLKGRNMRVNKARPRSDGRQGRGRRGGGGRGQRPY